MNDEDPISMTWPQYLRNECTYKNEIIHLTNTEKELLFLFLMRRGTMVHYNDIIGYLWPNPDNSPDWEINSVRVYIARLRHKRGLDVIKTQYGGGYYFIPKPDGSLKSLTT